jgi:hypothetical protein
MLALAAPAALAEDGGEGLIAAPFTPFQLSFASGYSQLFEKATPVYGLRLNAFYGVQSEVVGIDVGPFNEVDTSIGLGMGVANIVHGDATGLQIGVASVVDEQAIGAQAGLANIVGGTLRGAQFGVINRSENATGFQLGIVNVSRSMAGLQVGLLNFNEKGFLPVFPIFNFGL